jgi:hypothetical protein
MHIQLITLNLLLGAGLTTLAAAPSLAQVVNNADALKDFKTESTDPFSNRGGDNYGGVFDLIHKVMQGSPDNAAFQAEQQQNLDDAATNFKALQRQRLQPTAATTPAATAPTPTLPIATP